MKNDFLPEFVSSNPHDKHGDIGLSNTSDVAVKLPNTAAKQKKPYEKPAFRFEKVFVTTALSCGKLSGTCGVTSSKVS